MELDLYQVDAFADRVFRGNPAAVCPLDEWLDDAILQDIATETNLSDTAFFVPADSGYQLRWFTPEKEVKLCGHATLATAYVLYEKLAYSKPAIHFETLSGPLIVKREGERYTMDFPSQDPARCDEPEFLSEALGVKPIEVLKNDDYVAIFEDEETIRAISPDLNLLRKIPCRGVVVSAPGSHADFVSRFFAPRYGINEDPVTGSTHCGLTPYWQRRLGKNPLRAEQLSRRGGSLLCELQGDRVLLSGQAALFMEGTMHIEKR